MESTINISKVNTFAQTSKIVKAKSFRRTQHKRNTILDLSTELTHFYPYATSSAPSYKCKDPYLCGVGEDKNYDVCYQQKISLAHFFSSLSPFSCLYRLIDVTRLFCHFEE